ncbi:endonuclease/exonuclease/phosphatase family protein [Snodgrassella sp. B3882]|uniref:endonuclease/exonuclease/phosphatase family protein n=1 Tax=Snodgrassella sp. B3882 TaxID=2818037 RepID=UPI00226A8AF4|nr:endonuclease/exonuclease/phosphatase family protein [Snodgrassella sp. B3882]MCX8745825.1 endonuclease/exonuclease/phosphatase family protein [Snodgrassella sp. B3882]
MKKYLLSLGWLSLTAMLLGQLSSGFWIFEQLSHFTPFYTLVLLGLCFIKQNKIQRCIFASVSICGCYFCFTPWLPSYAGDALTAAPVRILSYNVLYKNKDIARESSWIYNSKHDVIFLTEASTVWGRMLQPLATTTQNCAHYKDSPFGIALYSRLPLKSCEVLYTPDNRKYPYIRAELQNGLIIYGLHPPPPLTTDLLHKRNKQLQALAASIRQEKNNVVVLGDMNISAFSPVFQEFIQAADVHLTSPRARPTWLPGLLSIDHALVRQTNKIVAVGSYSWQGSDHRAIWISYLP